MLCSGTLVDKAVDLVDHRVAVAQVTHMHAQFVIEGALAEVEEVHVRLRIFQHPRVLLRGRAAGADQIEVGAVIDSQLEGHAGDGIGQRPVDQLSGNKCLVRDDDVFAVEVGDGNSLSVCPHCLRT